MFKNFPSTVRILKRAVALTVSISLLGIDASWAKGWAPNPRPLPLRERFFSSQALQPLLKAGYRTPLRDVPAVWVSQEAARLLRAESGDVRKTWSIVLRPLLVPLLIFSSLFGQKAPPKNTAPPALSENQFQILAPEVPLPPTVAEVMEENKKLIENAPMIQNVWDQGVRAPEDIDQPDDFVGAVINNSPDIVTGWLKMQSNAEIVLSLASRDGSIALSTDPNRAALFNLGGTPGLSLANTTVYARFQDAHAFQRVESFTVPKPHETPFGKLWRYTKDLFDGGIVFNSDTAIQKNLIRLQLAFTNLRIQFADVFETAQKQLLAFNVALNALRDQDAELREKTFRQHVQDKQSHQMAGGAISNTEGISDEAAEAENAATDISLQGLEVKRSRGDLEDALQRQLILHSKEAEHQARIHPRFPTLVIDEAMLRALAELKIGENEDSPASTAAPPLPRKALLQLLQERRSLGDRRAIAVLAQLKTVPPSDPKYRFVLENFALNEGLLKRLTALRGIGDQIPAAVFEGAKNRASAFDRDYLNDLLNYGWSVVGYSQTISLPAPDQDPRRVIVVSPPLLSETGSVYISLSTLATLMAHGDSALGLSPHEQSLQFQADLMTTVNELDEQYKKRDVSGALRINWAFTLPLRAELSGTLRTDSPALTHEMESNALLAQTIPYKIQAYRLNGPLKEWQQLRQRQIELLERSRLLARRILANYEHLVVAFYPASVSQNKTQVNQPITNFETSAELIVLDEERLRAALSDLVGIQDEAFWLTPAGLQRVNDELKAHIQSASEAIKLLMPVQKAATAPASAQPPLSQKPLASRKKSKGIHIPGVIDTRPRAKQTSTVKPSGLWGKVALASALGLFLAPALNAAPAAAHLFQDYLPQLRYWTNPLLQGATVLSLVLVMLSWPYYRRDGYSDSRPGPYRFLFFQGLVFGTMAWASAILFDNFSLGFFLSAATLYFARTILPWMNSKYPIGSVRYWITQRLNAKQERSVWIHRLGRSFLLLTSFWMLWNPLAHYAKRQWAGLWGEESAGTVDVSSAIATEDLYVAAPPHESGHVVNPPIVNGKTHFESGQWFVAWRGPQDGATLARIQSINQQLRRLKLPSGIGHLDELSSVHFGDAFIQIESDGAEWSIERRLDENLGEIETTLQSAELSGNIDLANQASNASSKVSIYRAELSQLSQVASALLEERSYREIKVVRPFDLLPDANLAGRSAHIDGSKPLLAGTQLLSDMVSLQIPYSPEEALSLESFKHSKNAVAVFRDQVTGKRYIFRPGDILRVVEPAHAPKGFYGAYYTLPNIGAQPELILVVEVSLKHAPQGAHVYLFEGFYHDAVLSNLDLPTLPQGLRLAPVKIRRPAKVALLGIVPSGFVSPHYAGPESALAAQLDAYHAAIRNLRAAAQSANNDFIRNNGTHVSKTHGLARNARDIVVWANTQVVGLEAHVRQLDDEKTFWEKTGATGEKKTAAGQTNSLEGKVFPLNPVASASYPLTQQFAIPGTVFAEEHTIGKTERLRMTVNGDYHELAAQPGSGLIISIPGTSTSFEATFVKSAELHQRGFGAALFTVDAEVKADDLEAPFPGISEGHAPAGLETVEVSRFDQPLGKPQTIVHEPAAAQQPKITHPWNLRRLQAMGLAAIAFLIHQFFAFGVLTAILVAGLIEFYLAKRVAQWLQTHWGQHVSALRSVGSKASMNAEQGLALFYGANGQFKTRSQFLNAVRVGHVGAGTLQTNLALDDLPANWTSYDDKDAVSKALKAGVDRITNRTVLGEMALALGVDPDLAPANHPDALKAEIKKQLGTRFSAMLLVAADHKADEPLMDAAIYPDNTRALFIDSEWFGDALKALRGTTGTSEKEMEAAQCTLLLAVYFTVAAPKEVWDISDKGRLRIIHSARSENFMRGMDTLFAYFEQTNEHAFTRNAYNAWERKARRRPDFQIYTTGLERTLAVPGLEQLGEQLTHSRLNFEVFGVKRRWYRWSAKAERLSGAEWLFVNHQDENVTLPMARLLSLYDRVNTKYLDLGNKRTTFILLEAAFFLIGVVWWGFHPTLLRDLYDMLLAGNLTWAVFSGHNSESSRLHSALLQSFVGLLITSFFFSVFKNVSEPAAGGFYWVNYFRAWLKRNPEKTRAEFKALTTENATDELENYRKISLTKDEEFRQPLTAYSRVMVSRVQDYLRNAPLDIRRLAVAALYDYAEDPLHPTDVSFFKDLGPMTLPSDAQVLAALGNPGRFQEREIRWLLEPAQATLLQGVAADLGRSHLRSSDFASMGPEEEIKALGSLRRHGFPFDDQSPFKLYDSGHNGRRDQMEQVRVRMAIEKMGDFPVLALLALISRDLQGLAFDPKTQHHDPAETELLRKDLKLYVKRLRTLARDVYVSYRKYSRISMMERQFTAGMDVMTHNRKDQVDALYEKFSDVLSDREIDITRPEVQKVLVDAGKMTKDEQRRTTAWNKILLLDGLAKIAPFATLQMRRFFKLVRSVDDPEEKLALALLLAQVKPEEMIPKAVRALREILSIKLSALLSANHFDRAELERIIQSPDFFIYRKLSEQNGLDLEKYLEDYVRANGDEKRQTALLTEYLGRLKLAQGLQSGLLFLWSRRLLKSDSDVHETLSAELHVGDEAADPSTFPVPYLMTKFLQDNNLKPTTSMASFLRIEGRSALCLKELTGLVRSGGPAPYGKQAIIQEASLDTNIQRALRDVQTDTLLTKGGVYHIAISRRGLKSFIWQAFDRISSRVRLNADHIHFIFYDQIRHMLHRPSALRRVLFVSPEINSLRILADDPEIKNSIIAGVPNPFLTSAAKLLIFWTMMPQEKRAFLKDVGARRGGAEEVKKLETSIEELLFAFNSSKLDFTVEPQRHKVVDGHTVDVLETMRPPVGYSTLWGTQTDDIKNREPKERNGNENEEPRRGPQDGKGNRWRSWFKWNRTAHVHREPLLSA